MAELTDLTPLQNHDLVLGGIVTGVREGYTKTGKPYGIAKVEDYSGTAEFAFFGNEWVEKKNFFMEGMFLFMKGKCQPKQWKQEEWEVKINSIELLPEVKERVVEKLTVTAPLSAIDDQLIMEFSSLVKDSPGNAELHFLVRDEDGQMYVNLMSRTMKISVQKEQAEQQELLDANKQTVSMLIIDKKRMKMKDAGLPQMVIDQTPKMMRGSKLPIIKAKVGPQIVSLICDEKIFESVPVKKEVKAVVSGIYVLDVKGLHGKTEAAPEKKKGFFKRMIASAQEKAGAKPVK
jgi:hypothetical protein